MATATANPPPTTSTSSSSSTTSSGFPSTHPRVEQVYELGNILGKGSFSTVFLGTHKVTKEKVALKVIPAKNYRHNERAKQLLRTEVAVMSRIRKLHHPNLMNFKHTFEDAEKIVMVLEILSGGELFDRIVKKGHYSERDASLLTGVIVRALGALHSVGILHRDLKPENCIYSTPADDSDLKITDFGLAAIVASPTERLYDRHLVGTPGYICPAVLTNYEYSAASDIWAAGVILFILLSGSPPFYGRTHKEIFEKIKTAHWGFNGRNWSQVSDGAKDLVTKLLKQNPSERLTVEQILEHPWIKEHEAVSSTHLPDTLDSLKKFNARQKFRAAAMVCIGSSRLQRVLMSATGKEGGASGGGGGEERLDEILGPSTFTTEELEILKTEFGQAAAASGGKGLNFAQFEEIMQKLKWDHLPLKRIFKVFDTNGTGDVDYREFLVGMSKFKLEGPAALKFCFEVFDEDNSGAISREELTKVLVHTRRKSAIAGGAGGAGAHTHARRSTADSVASAASAASTHTHTNTPPLQPQAGPFIVEMDDGETAHLVEAPEKAAGAGAGAGTGATPPTNTQAKEFERTNPRYMEMDPDAYEVAESIAELFDSLDANHDNQVTFDEFLEGAKRHPDLFEVFLRTEGGEGGEEEGGHGNLRGAGAGGMSV